MIIKDGWKRRQPCLQGKTAAVTAAERLRREKSLLYPDYPERQQSVGAARLECRSVFRLGKDTLGVKPWSQCGGPRAHHPFVVEPSQ